jgi:arginine-tRNA-protein transferase
MHLLDSFRTEQDVCPYLPDRAFHSENLVIGRMQPEDYLALLSQSYRRSGRILYRPVCAWCRQCISLRVLVQEFRPTRSQSRAWRKNQDLEIRITEPRLDQLHLALYNDYLRRKHPSPARDAQGRNALEYWGFLVDSPVPTLEFQYWAGPRLLGVGIVDDLGTSASSVYFYFDLDARARSLGVYSVLVEIEWARRRGYRHHYLGYWVRDAASMAYKARYRPAEILLPDGRWTRFPDPGPSDLGEPPELRECC